MDINKVNREARKSDDPLKRDFNVDQQLKKALNNIAEVSTKDGKFYVSAILDSIVIEHEMDDNMRAELYKRKLINAHKSFGLIVTIMHSNRGSQYTSEKYRDAVRKCGVRQSMNSACGNGHDNAR